MAAIEFVLAWFWPIQLPSHQETTIRLRKLRKGKNERTYDQLPEVQSCNQTN